MRTLVANTQLLVENIQMAQTCTLLPHLQKTTQSRTGVRISKAMDTLRSLALLLQAHNGDQVSLPRACTILKAQDTHRDQDIVRTNSGDQTSLTSMTFRALARLLLHTASKSRTMATSLLQTRLMRLKIKVHCASPIAEARHLPAVRVEASGRSSILAVQSSLRG